MAAVNALPVQRDGTDTTAWLSFYVPGIIWGASFLFIAEGLRAMGPGGVAAASGAGSRRSASCGWRFRWPCFRSRNSACHRRDLVNAQWTPGPLLSILALGALGTGLAFVLTASAAGRYGSTRASATAFLIPPVALALGVAVRGEHVALLAVIGAAVCVWGAWIIRRVQTR